MYIKIRAGTERNSHSHHRDGLGRPPELLLPLRHSVHARPLSTRRELSSFPVSLSAKRTNHTQKNTGTVIFFNFILKMAHLFWLCFVELVPTSYIKYDWNNIGVTTYIYIIEIRIDTVTASSFQLPNPRAFKDFCNTQTTPPPLPKQHVDGSSRDSRLW